MKLHTLQLFLRSLVLPLEQCSASAAAEDVRATCDLLSSFGELELDQFKGLVSLAREYQKAKEIRVPFHLQTVVSCFETLRALKERASSAEVSKEELAHELLRLPLNDLEKPDLVALAKELGSNLASQAKKDEAIDAIWRSLTGGPRPRKTATAGKTAKAAKAAFPVEVYAQKVNELKDRANLPETRREELERELAELRLDKLSKDDAVKLARELSCPVNSRTNKGEAIQEIHRSVLLVKETLVGSAS